jgi:hypothetical protein
MPARKPPCRRRSRRLYAVQKLLTTTDAAQMSRLLTLRPQGSNGGQEEQRNATLQQAMPCITSLVKAEVPETTLATCTKRSASRNEPES